jgi:hypothetical protein
MFFQISFAQSPLSVKWLVNSTGASWDLVSDMVVDKDNNLYLVGNFTDTISSDNQAKGVQEDIFVAKYNQEGESIWLHKLKSEDYCQVKSLIINDNNQCFISGYQLNATSQKLKNQNIKNPINLFVTKIDEFGDKTEFVQIEGKFNSMPVQLVGRNNQGILIGGSFTNITFEDSTYISKGKTDIFILTCDEKGNHEKLLLLQGYGKNTLNNIKIDSNGCTYITGSFEKELEVDYNLLTSNGRSDGYLIKLNPKLEVEFIKQFGSYYEDYGKTINIDSLNNVIVSGSFSGQFVTENNDTIISKGKLDVFTAKYSETGSLLWTNSFGGIGNEYLSSCYLNDLNDIYLTGNYRGEIEEGKYHIISEGFSSDIFVAKYTSNGQFRYIESIGDTNTDFVSSIVIDSLNFIYLTGNFNKSMKVLSDTTKEAIKEDFYLTKLYDCDFSPKIKLPNDTSICEDQFVIVADSNFVKYMWNELSGNHKYSVDTTGNYYLEAYDEHGCITSDTIFVKINTPVQVDLGDDLTVELGETVIISTTEDFDEYLWCTTDTTFYIELLTEQFAPGKIPISIVTKDANGCSSNDQLILEIIQEMDDESIQIGISPNPTKSTINLSVKNTKPGITIEYQLITEVGVMILNKTKTVGANAFYENISLESLQPGVYYLKVHHEGLTEVMKIIKL